MARNANRRKQLTATSHGEPCGDGSYLLSRGESGGPEATIFRVACRIRSAGIARPIAAKKERGWTRHKIYSDFSGDDTSDYVSKDDADMPAYNVFTHRDGAIRHFWSNEMGSSTADPGQDPRGAPDIDPLWTILDTAPEGRDMD